MDRPRQPRTPVNSTDNDLQPAFTAAGDTLYFTSDRCGLGSSIYRSVRQGEGWGEPESAPGGAGRLAAGRPAGGTLRPSLVICGIVGEPSPTADSRLLYFVHVLSDAAGLFDADIWVSARRP